MTGAAPHFDREHVAIVTGGSQGLGLAVAAEMVHNGLSKMVVVGRNSERGTTAAEKLTSMGAEAEFVQADLGTVEGPARVLERVTERFGVVHALVNAAAKTDRDSVWQSTPELFDSMMATNVRGPYLLIQGVAAGLRAAGAAGSIVNVGSVAGHGGPPFISSYSASKGALMVLTKNLANALAPHHIRVNMVSPGWMDTPAEDAIQRKYHGAGDDWREQGGSALPFGRLLDPAEVARMIAFLASPASGIVTGAVVDFDQQVWTGGPTPAPHDGEAENLP